MVAGGKGKRNQWVHSYHSVLAKFYSRAHDCLSSHFLSSHTGQGMQSAACEGVDGRFWERPLASELPQGTLSSCYLPRNITNERERLQLLWESRWKGTQRTKEATSGGYKNPTPAREPFDVGAGVQEFLDLISGSETPDDEGTHQRMLRPGLQGGGASVSNSGKWRTCLPSVQPVPSQHLVLLLPAGQLSSQRTWK